MRGHARRDRLDIGTCMVTGEMRLVTTKNDNFGRCLRRSRLSVLPLLSACVFGVNYMWIDKNSENHGSQTKQASRILF